MSNENGRFCGFIPRRGRRWYPYAVTRIREHGLDPYRMGAYPIFQDEAEAG